MAVTRSDYPDELTQAAKSVLIEVIHILGEYREHIVLVGGSVPELLISNPSNPHVGSTDVDLAINHRELNEPGYKAIQVLLAENDYVQSDEQPFIYTKSVLVGSKEISIHVDFLAGEYEGTGKSRRTQKVLDISPRKVRGADIVFDSYEEIEIVGKLPSGVMDKVRLKVASIPALLVMKGIALRDRKKEKDAYDIYFVIRHYTGGLEALASEINKILSNGLVQEGFRNIAEAFSSTEDFGPSWVADFEGIPPGGDRDILIRDAHERVTQLVELLGL